MALAVLVPNSKIRTIIFRFLNIFGQSIYGFRSLPKIWYNLLFYHNSITVENFLKRFADLKIPQLDLPRPIEKRILESRQYIFLKKSAFQYRDFNHSTIKPD